MCHVLVIEDDPLIARIVSEVAIGAGATSIDVVNSPSQALACALASPPVMILSDVNIVDGTGPEAVNAIRERLGDLPVIFLTGTPAGCDQCGHAGVFLKPFNAEDVTEAIRHLIPAG